jgi:hypothetical protein
MTTQSSGAWPWWVTVGGWATAVLGYAIGYRTFDMRGADLWLFALMVYATSILELKLYVIRQGQLRR